MAGAEIVEPLATRKVVEVHWGAGVKGRAEVGSGAGGMDASAGMAVDAEFFQGSLEGGDMMLAKHMHLHLRLEAID